MRRPAINAATIALLAWSLCATAHADDIDAIVRAEMARQKLPGLALAIVRDGTVVKVQGYGHADVARAVPVTPDTVFKIGSVSKPLIASAVMLLAHAKVEKFEDPEASPYDRFSPRLHKHAAALVTEWCDAVLFATRKFRTQTEETGFGRKRTTAHAVGKDGGERILRTVGGPSCVAKNRYGLDAELRSLSQGLASFNADFDHLQELTGKHADDVVRARVAEAA